MFRVLVSGRHAVRVIEPLVLVENCDKIYVRSHAHADMNIPISPRPIFSDVARCHCSRGASLAGFFLNSLCLDRLSTELPTTSLNRSVYAIERQRQRPSLRPLSLGQSPAMKRVLKPSFCVHAHVCQPFVASIQLNLQFIFIYP